MHENVFHTGPYNSFSLDELFSRKSSTAIQSLTSLPVLNTPDKENIHNTSTDISPCLPATESVYHNVPRMLNGYQPQVKGDSNAGASSLRASRYAPYSTSHFLSFRHKTLQESTGSKRDEKDIDVLDDSQDNLRTSDVPNTTDSSISTHDSTSPKSSASSSSPASSARASPESVTEPVTSPETSSEQTIKKKARTNYTNEQIQTLLKLFHENPYPESEMMENIAKDFGVPENKIKIWFQNKRARWRRRVNDNMNHFPGQPFMPVSPMLSPVPSYGPMYGNMMSSSPQHPAYFNYPWMQSGALGPNNSNNNQPLPGHSRLPHTNMTATPVTSTYFPPVSMPTSISPMSPATAYPLRTSPQQMMTSQQRQYQYPHFLYGSQGYHGGQ